MLSTCRPLVLALLISLHTLLQVGEELQGSRAPQSLQSGLSGGYHQAPRIVHNETKPTTHTHTTITVTILGATKASRQKSYRIYWSISSKPKNTILKQNKIRKTCKLVMVVAGWLVLLWATLPSWQNRAVPMVLFILTEGWGFAKQLAQHYYDQVHQQFV